MCYSETESSELKQWRQHEVMLKISGSEVTRSRV